MMEDEAKPLDPEGRSDELEEVTRYVLDQAGRRGASAAEVGASLHQGLSVTVRMGEVETLEYSRDRGLSITVYFDRQKGSATSADLSRESVDTSVERACEIARHTESDPHTGLADPDRMARDFPDLDLWHPWSITAEQAIEMAEAMEKAALDHDPLIANSEGGSVSSGISLSVYANSHGFVGRRRSSRQSMSCVVLAQDESSMQRDYWYDTRRAADDLAGGPEIGRRAAERAVQRHGAGSVSTCEVPVLFAPEVARTLLGHLVSAISGGNLYRKASFLLDQVGEQIFPEFVEIGERPFEARGLRSASFDAEGVATFARNVVEQGVLTGYVLSSYSARKLGLESTANAGGVHNLTLTPGEASFEELVAEMGRGLIVTEVMGQGVNIVTGDYSRGASGFWVEDGQIQRPVEGVTVATNLRDLFAGIRAVGNDFDDRSGIRCGSILVDRMTVAGD